MSKGTPRRLRMNRAARLQSAKHWLPTYPGRDLVKGYQNWYGVSKVCAIIELRQLGINVDEQRLIQAKRDEETNARQRSREKRENSEKRLATEPPLIESNADFAYIAGYTGWGFPYGVTWAELECETADDSECQ